MEKVLFISNEAYLDTRRPEGGVRVCTLEFIKLLEQKYEVVLFPVKINQSIFFKIKMKFGLGSYDAYKPSKYLKALNDVLEENNIKLVFLNMSNLIKFSFFIKKLCRGNTKVIICSHGNESGDYLHEVVRFREKNSFAKKLFSSYALGKMLKTESFYRLHFIDMVLTVSDVESEIEKWLGTRKVYMIPRTIKQNFLKIDPVTNRVGFIGDLSHSPNNSGIISFCNALNKLRHNINLRIIGGPPDVGNTLQNQYSFITYLGYLDNSELRKECATWYLFLNLVFYYSRGVSTKLANPISWGLPVISTTAGIRGYLWTKGKMLMAETPDAMASAVLQVSKEHEQLVENARLIASSLPTLENIMNELNPQLQAL